MRNRIPLDGPICVRLEAYMPIPASWSKKRQAQALIGLLRPVTKPDLDNIFKQCDALNGIVWRDDKQIVEASITKFYSDKPRLVLTVSEITHAPGSDNG